MKNYYPSIVLLCGAMFSIQIGASVARQMFPVVGVLETTMLRLCLATLILLLIYRPWKSKIHKKDAISIIVYGVSLGLMNLLFYLSLERMPLGIVVSLEFVGPLIVAVYHSRGKLDFIWVCLAMLGVALLLPVMETTAKLDLIGILFALGAGLCWALYIVFGKKAGTSLDSGKTTALGITTAALIVLPFSFFSSNLSSITLEIIPLALVVAIFSSILPYSFEMTALQNIPSKIFGILLSIEPVLAAFVGYIFLNEHLTGIQFLAIALIIIACLGSTLSKDVDPKELKEH